MNWSTLYLQEGGFQSPRAASLIMAAAWKAMADWPDESPAQTAVSNTMTPEAVMSMMDWRGIPVPTDILR